MIRIAINIGMKDEESTWFLGSLCVWPRLKNDPVMIEIFRRVKAGV
jgi:hypothetical protein